MISTRQGRTLYEDFIQHGHFFDTLESSFFWCKLLLPRSWLLFIVPHHCDLKMTLFKLFFSPLIILGQKIYNTHKSPWNILILPKVIYPKYSKHWLYIVAHTNEIRQCSKYYFFFMISCKILSKNPFNLFSYFFIKLKKKKVLSALKSIKSIKR